MTRKREDSATVGDLEDLASSIRDGLKEAFKGNVIPAPTPKGDGDKGDGDKGDGDKGDGGDGGEGTPVAEKWGFSGRWWGDQS